MGTTGGVPMPVSSYIHSLNSCQSADQLSFVLGQEAGLTKSSVEAGDQGACPSADTSSFVPSQDAPRSSAPFVGPQLDLEAALRRCPTTKSATACKWWQPSGAWG